MQLDITPINRIALEFLGQYRKRLIDGGHHATGDLINNSTYVVEYDGRYLTVSLNLPEHWKWLEYGRKPNSKFPPVDAIRKWIRVKPILPRAYNGKVPTENQLAFLIGRKIARDGLPAHRYLMKTEEQFDIVGRVYDEITSQVGKLMNDAVGEVFDQN